MFAVMGIERLWLWPERYHPLAFFRYLTQHIGQKVHPSVERSHQQQYISGTLAVIVITLPTVVIASTFVWFAEFPLFFDAMMLLVALHFHPVTTHYERIIHALKANKKMLARDTLSHIVLRETDKLSPMGIAKAAVESVLLRFCYQYWAVLFWYLILGGAGALAYRLIFEMSQQWNRKTPYFAHFGKPASTMMLVLSWLPTRWVVYSLAIAENISGAFKAARNIRYQLTGAIRQHTTLLAIAGGAMGIQLGGPAFYGGKKIRMAKVGGSREIRFGDLARIRLALMKVTAMLCVFLLLVFAIIYVF